MPKLVDHDQQRQIFAEAAKRLVSREGFEALTMRNVAREAGLSYGSLFHYFDSKDELLMYAVGLHTEAQVERINSFSSRRKGLKALEQLITDDSLVDHASRDEWMVWQAFVYRSALQERVAQMHADLIAGWVARIENLLDEAREMGQVRPELDCANEARALWVFSAGLGQQGLLHPKTLSPTRQKQLIRQYLAKLKPIA